MVCFDLYCQGCGWSSMGAAKELPVNKKCPDCDDKVLVLPNKNDLKCDGCSMEVECESD